MWVLRHAKAASHATDDRSRPLTARGTRQAADVGRYVAGAPVEGVPVPELVLSSAARRAVQTAEIVAGRLAPSVELLVERALYDADADDVVELVRQLGGDAPSVLVVGHNPTVHDFAVLVLDEGDPGRTRLEQGFPTAALAVVGVRAPAWARLSTGAGRLLDLWTPPS